MHLTEAELKLTEEQELAILDAVLGDDADINLDSLLPQYDAETNRIAIQRVMGAMEPSGEAAKR